MKKISVLLIAVAAVAVGCVSPGDQLCLTTAECAGEDDPAAFCQDAADDLDEDQQKIRDACKSEGDAFAQCFLDNGECKDEVFGDADTLEACADEAEASAKCAEDNA
jgi:hypothetical protein